jgi:hypothetical protein
MRYMTVDDLGTRGHEGVWGILDLCKRHGPRKKLCQVLMTIPGDCPAQFPWAA